MTTYQAARTSVSTRRVILAGIPVRRFLHLHDHLDTLVAELQVIAVPGHRHPSEVLALVPLLDGLTGPFASVREATRQRARSAGARGDETFTLDASLPTWAAEQVERWNHLLDSADACASAGLLLTAPASPEVVELRRWIGAEVAAQLRD